MNRIFWIIVFSIITLSVQAQNVGVSPYSAWGYGDKKLNFGAATFGMADVSTPFQSELGNQSNFMNPAANANLRLTNFSFEGGTDVGNFQNNNESFTRTSSYLSRIHLGFPMGQKFRAGIGFQPFSSVGYKTGNYNYSTSPISINQLEGVGGLNTLQAMLSYNVTSKLAVGVRGDYIFGDIEKRELFSTSNTQLVSEYKQGHHISGLQATLGGMYIHNVAEDKRLQIGATYSIGSQSAAEQQYRVSTFQLNPIDFTRNNEDVLIDRVSDRKVRIPQNVSAGLMYVKDRKWQLGAQVDWEQTSDYRLQFENYEMADRFRVALGGAFIPNITSFRSFFSRSSYRAGLYYGNSPIVARGQHLQDYGITFGIGIPVGRAASPSEVNLGVQLGQRGSLESNLIRENYANFRLSFTLNDLWFQRRVYD
ncbi:MAG: hypothetical protein Q4F57_03370 [Weeksellaceae bacterium]|nr:hypothetical protein [Weeksellaceae bacterium]